MDLYLFHHSNAKQSVAMTKIVLMDDYTRGGDETYIISIENSEASELIGVTVTENQGECTFGAGTVYSLDYVPESVGSV